MKNLLSALALAALVASCRSTSDVADSSTAPEASPEATCPVGEDCEEAKAKGCCPSEAAAMDESAPQVCPVTGKVSG